MARDSERYDYSHLIGSSAGENDKKFDASRFDELLNDEDRRLLESGLHISWWVYSEISMRPSHQA